MKKSVVTARRNVTTLLFTLEKGQIWKTADAYVRITDAGKRLVHYSMATRLHQRGLRNHVASIETVQAFLKSKRAELVVKA